MNAPLESPFSTLIPPKNPSLYSSSMAGKRTINPRAMLDFRALGCAKAPILSAISLAAVFIVIYMNSIVSISLCSYVFKAKESHGVQIRLAEGFIRNIPLRSMQEEIKLVGGDSNSNDDSDGDDRVPPVPPLNLTEEERIKWFSEKLAEFEILKSDDLTRQFHGRVLEFFNEECEVQFFMTWISSAVSFGRREYLSMESLFSAHPRGCLVIVSRTLDSGRGYRILKPLLDRGFRVVAVAPDLPFLLKNTPAEAWLDSIRSGNKDPGEIPLAQNLSNLIRLAVLYRYGGVYLDTDFVVLKSFKGLRNSIGAQSMDVTSMKWNRLNNAVLVFDLNHPLLLKFMEEFASTFDGSKWGHNGPYLVSRVTAKVEGRLGYNFTVMPPMAFYPVIWTKIEGFFKKPRTRGEERWTEAKLLQMSGETYGVHLWNKATRQLEIEEGSIMAKLISDHCVICEDTYSS